MTEVIDYAYPMMMAENALKEAHIHMLNKEYDEAVEQMFAAMTEAKITLNAIKHMKEKDHGIRQQTASV